MEFMTEDRQGPVSVITWNHGAQNQFHTPFLEEFLGLLDAAAKDKTVTAVVVTGAQEKFFSTGLFLEWMMAEGAKDINVTRGFLRMLNKSMLDVTSYTKPIIAAINGHTVGMGCILSGCMDFRIMREDYGFVRLPEVQINIPFWPGMNDILVEVMGESNFRKMAYTGEKFGPQDAKKLGFIDKVVPREDLVSTAVEMAQTLGQSEASTYGIIKNVLRRHVLKVMREEDPIAIGKMLAEMEKNR